MLLDLLRADGSIIVNKRLARNIGLDAAIMYSELVSKYFYFEARQQLTDDGHFFNTVENMEEDTTLSDHQQRKAIKKLIELGLIKQKVIGIPARRYFYIVPDENVIRKCLQTQENQQFLKKLRTRSQKIKELELKKVQSNNTNLNNTKEIILNKDKGLFSYENQSTLFNKDEVLCCVKYYFEKYKHIKGYEHPKLKPKQLERVCSTIDSFVSETAVDTENLVDMIDQYFNTSPGYSTDHNINHFATEGILQNRMWEVAY